MSAIVRRNDRYIADYQMQSGELFFAWTKNIDKAAEYDDDFAALLAREVDGKIIPVMEEGNDGQTPIHPDRLHNPPSQKAALPNG